VDGIRIFDLLTFTFRENIDPKLKNASYEFAVGAGPNAFYTIGDQGIQKVELPQWKLTQVQLPYSLFMPEYSFCHGLYPLSDTSIIAYTNHNLLTLNTQERDSILQHAQVYISSVLIDEQPYTYKLIPNYLTRITLPPNASVLDIYVSNTNYHMGNSMDNVWYTISDYDAVGGAIGKDGKLHLANLPRDREMQLQIIDKNTGSLLKEITLYAEIYWYKKTWVKLLLGILFLLAIVFYYRQKLQLVRLKNEQNQKVNELTLLKSDFERQISEVETAALRSQMNPHFIFNGLNSIQLYILENESEKASSYLIKFSKLIRLVLENSRKSLVTLQSDLLALQLYLEIEQLRFGDKLTYCITVASAIDQETEKIPALLIQPFVENAIWHGLMQKTQGGHILINVEKDAAGLVIGIQDDGIGRARAAKENAGKNDRESYGMKITTERMAIINKMYAINSTVVVEDIMIAGDNPAGTKVTLRIPTIITVPVYH